MLHSYVLWSSLAESAPVPHVAMPALGFCCCLCRILSLIPCSYSSLFGCFFPPMQVLY